MTTIPSNPLLKDLALTSGPQLYQNPLASPNDITDWQMEGPGATSFPLNAMRMESIGDPEAGQKSNLVLWCPESFPDNIHIRWQFRPILEPGLAILFFAAKGKDGQHVLDPSLKPRTGPYNQYNSSDLSALHVSYFRRHNPDEIRMQICNLRKSAGFHLVAQGPDPIPSVAQSTGWYEIAVIKAGPLVRFCVDNISCFTWQDDNKTHGPTLTEGSIGFRQMNPLIAEYRNLTVEKLEK